MSENTWSLSISVTQLREIASRLLDCLQEEAGDSVELTEDDYWEIADDERYNLLDSPGDPVVGKLSDDWHELQRLLAEDYTPLLWHDLAHLAPMLRAIGERARE